MNYDIFPNPRTPDKAPTKPSPHKKIAPIETAKPHHHRSSWARASRRYKTDARGQFRFAPIERGPNDYIRGHSSAAAGSNHTDAPLQMTPIPIFPHEFETALRADDKAEAEFGLLSGGSNSFPPENQFGETSGNITGHLSGA